MKIGKSDSYFAIKITAQSANFVSEENIYSSQGMLIILEELWGSFIIHILIKGLWIWNF